MNDARGPLTAEEYYEVYKLVDWNIEDSAVAMEWTERIKPLLPRLLQDLEDTREALAACQAEGRSHEEVERFVRKAVEKALGPCAWYAQMGIPASATIGAERCDKCKDVIDRIVRETLG